MKDIDTLNSGFLDLELKKLHTLFSSGADKIFSLSTSFVKFFQVFSKFFKKIPHFPSRTSKSRIYLKSYKI